MQYDLKKNLKYNVNEILKGQEGQLKEIIIHQSKRFSLFGGTKEYKGLPIKFFDGISYLERVA